MWYLTEYILDQRPHGYLGGIVWGTQRGIGKSSYVLHVAHQLFMNDGYSDEEAWELALDSCVFLIQDLIEKIQEYDWRNRAKIIIWDDAGFHGSGMLYNLNQADAMLLKGIADTIRTSTECFLLTTPSIDDLIGFLKHYGDYEVKVSMNHDWQRCAHIVKPTKSVWGRKRYQDYGIDEFSAYLPIAVYTKYMNKRDRYRTEVIKEIEEWKLRHERKQKGEFTGVTSKSIPQSGLTL